MSEALGFVCLLLIFIIYWSGTPTWAVKIMTIIDYHYEQVIKGKQNGSDKTKKGKAGSTGG